MATDEPSKSALPYPVRIGRRVALRHTLAADDASGARFNDVTGELLAADADGVRIAARAGEVFVSWDRVVAAKEIPPRAPRPGHPHRTIGVDDLQRLMVDGLPGLRQLPIGDWLLRTAEGYTGRANSALVIGDPGCAIAEGVERVVAAYDGLAQPALFQIAGEPGFDAAQHPVAAAVLERGGRIFQRTLVMTAAVREVAMASPRPNTAIEVTPTPTEAWWAALNDRGRDRRELVERVVAEVHDGRFLTARRRDGQAVASGRIAYSPGWVGLFDLHTVPAQRGQGYGRALIGEAARDALLHAARSFYLQVSADNAAAIRLYDSLGFGTHHEYWYARLG